MKKLVTAIAVTLAAVAICTAVLACGAKPKNPPPAAYAIYVYEDGSAQIEVGSISQVIQTHGDITMGGMELKAGTVILPGNGNEIYYEYPRRDYIWKEVEE